MPRRCATFAAERAFAFQRATDFKSLRATVTVGGTPVTFSTSDCFGVIYATHADFASVESTDGTSSSQWQLEVVTKAGTTCKMSTMCKAERKTSDIGVVKTRNADGSLALCAMTAANTPGGCF